MGLIAGTVAARLAAVALDDPTALARPRDLLVIRGGVEFWPGVLAGAAAIALAAWQAGTPPLAELADLAPYALVAYATYSSACLVRDGCFGPASPIGLRAAGTGPTEFPVDVAVAAAVCLLAVAVRRVGRRSLYWSLLIGVFGLASIRATAAIWLPRIGHGASRPQMESFAIAVVAGLVSTEAVASRRRLARWEGRGRVASSAPYSGAVDDGANHRDRSGHGPSEEQIL